MIPVRVAVEGIDGIGKTTVISRLREVLAVDHSVLATTMAPVTLDLMKSYGRDIHGADQAYWTEVGRRTKTQVFLTEAVVRARYLREYFEKFDLVIFDRWWHTFRAYSTGEEFDDRCRFLVDQLPALDWIFHLHGNPDVCAERLRAQDDWLTEQMPDAELPGFLDGMQAQYREMLGDDPRCIAIDCDGRTPEEIATMILPHLMAKLGEPTGRGVLDGDSVPYTRFAVPAQELVAIEGIDGAGKSTLVAATAAALPNLIEVHRLASASLAMFKASSTIDDDEQPSVAMRRQFEDEFRQQTYLVDGLVQLACLAGSETTAPIQLFDRWFPLFAIYQHQIECDRPLFDYLLGRYPKPDVVFYIDVPIDTAVDRLIARSDWMIDGLGADTTRRELQQMVALHEPELKKLGPVVRVVDGRLPITDSTALICSELSR